MAHLIRRQRRNPATGKVETYYLLQERGRAAEPLGYIPEATAKKALTLYEAELIKERAGAAPPPRSSSASSAPTPPPAPPCPTVREWWGTADLRRPADSPSRMHAWAIAQGKVGNALRVMNDSRKVFLADPIADLRLDAVTLAESDAFIARLRAGGCRSRTIQIRVGHLQLGLKAAHEYSVLRAPTKLKIPPNTDKKPTVFHTPEQARLLVEELGRRHARGFIDSKTLLAIAADVSLGLRKGELLSRRWPDLDWSAALLRVADQAMPDGSVWRPKKKASYRSVAVPPPLLAMFREEWMRQGRGDGWIFPSDESSGPRGDFRKALANACKAAGLPVLHPHALRHTWATGWLWKGATMADLVGEGGWSSPTVPSATYVHTTTDRRREIAAASSPLTKPADQASGSATGAPADHARSARQS